MIYVYQVFTSNEDNVINEIKLNIPSEYYNDCYFPLKHLSKKFQGKRRIVKRPMFPGYIFIDTDDIDKFNYLIRKTPSFTKLLGKEENEVVESLNDEETELINYLMGFSDNKHEVVLSEITFKENDEIEVIKGPLKGFSGQIKKINLHKRLATISLEVLGRLVETELSFDIVDKKDC